MALSLFKNIKGNNNNHADDRLTQLYNSKKFDLLICEKVEELLKKVNREETYLDTILKSFISDENSVNITNIDLNVHSSSLDLISDVYLIYAKYDLVDYLPILSSVSLARRYKDKTLLEILLEKNKDVTLKKIIKKSIKQDVNVGLLLNLNDVSQEDIDIEVLDINYEQKYSKEYYKDYDKGPIDDESSKLLNELRELLLKDNNSSLEAVDLIIKSYHYQISNNKMYAVDELRQLINIKRHTNFSIRLSSENVYDEVNNCILLKNSNIEVLNHELGHCLFTMLADRSVPMEFYQITKKMMNNPKIVKQVEKYSDEYHKVVSYGNNIIDTEYIKYFDELIGNNMSDEIQKILDKNIETYRKIYISRGYNPEKIERILNKIFTFDSHRKAFLRIRKRELLSTLLICRYATPLATGDIIDAVFKGKFYDNAIINADKEKVKGCSGHGVYYYNHYSGSDFSEIIANYSQIIKSSTASKGIMLLRNILGDEFVDFIDNYYRENIVYSKKYEQRSMI